MYQLILDYDYKVGWNDPPPIGLKCQVPDKKKKRVRHLIRHSAASCSVHSFSSLSGVNTFLSNYGQGHDFVVDLWLPPMLEGDDRFGREEPAGLQQ